MNIPLAMLPLGAKGRIIDITNGRELVRRLNDLGFIRDVEVKVVHSHSNNSHGGPLVIEVKDSRIAIGRGVAMKILVKEVIN